MASMLIPRRVSVYRLFTSAACVATEGEAILETVLAVVVATNGRDVGKEICVSMMQLAHTFGFGISCT